MTSTPSPAALMSHRARSDRASLDPGGPLFLLTVGVLFAVPGGLLWELGLNYDGITGSIMSKIHPSSYLAAVNVVIVMALKPSSASPCRRLLEKYGGSVLLFTFTIAALGFAAISRRPGLAGLIDTFCVPALLAITVEEVSEATRRRGEYLLHCILTCNAILTIYEAVTNHHIFPYRYEGQIPVELRPAGLQNHALSNAVVIGTYITILAYGAPLRLRTGVRATFIVLQLAALILTGGRAATVIVSCFLLLRGLQGCARVLAGRRFSRAEAALHLTVIPLVLLLVVVLVHQGVFGILLDRFNEDSGSAMTRAKMFRMFTYIPFEQIMLGPDLQTVDYVRRREGLELGIENPVVRFILYQGAVITMMMIVGVACFLVQIARSTCNIHVAPLIYFLAVISTFESIGTKGSLLAKYAVMTAVLTNLRPIMYGRR
ncbi:VpsF family polysaccharide biosynthesis protein [Methylobacterium sp. WSM2598]|uniref:VpsF family polysaccharide biosynthesis protein n=1 Tax=Methylobacterium sp. WSM2598 TaxID=398261 RepID=UPI0012F69EB6|nr:VpsF family polysaccharide biosynthesis protein [Methylobacterium sp. WSM2598]